MIEVRDNDLAWLLLATVRYSLGRRSTAPAMASDLVRRYGHEISEGDLAQIGEEIADELGRAYFRDAYLGDKCDHETWVALRDWVDGFLRKGKKE